MARSWASFSRILSYLLILKGANSIHVSEQTIKLGLEELSNIKSEARRQSDFIGDKLLFKEVFICADH
jgi:hypothetical protein